MLISTELTELCRRACFNWENSRIQKEMLRNDFFLKMRQMFSKKKTKIAVPSPMPKIRKALDRSVSVNTAILGLTGLMRHLSMGGR